MGGWFSSKPSPAPPQRPASQPRQPQYAAPTYNTPSPYVPTPTPHTYAQRTGPSTMQGSHTPTRIFRTALGGPRLATSVYKQEDTYKWHTESVLPLQNVPYTLVQLNRESEDYTRVYGLFRRTAQKQLKIQKIVRVENPFLMGSYILKREELNSRYNYSTEEKSYFHGTKSSNLSAICKNNFNWRLHGDSRGNRFGKGVSFSPIANYSSHYCDNEPRNPMNTMFLARVLVTNSVLGSKEMILPPNGYDTAMKANRQVIVKFCDDEFYPEFIIYFTGSAVQNINSNQRAC